MRRPSVADTLVERREAWLRALTPEERVQLALQLGEESVQLFRRARGVTRAEALAHHRAARRAGRLRSGSAEVDVDGAPRGGR